MNDERKIKVTVRIPKKTPESARRRKINRIYDILAIAKPSDTRYTVNG